MLRLKCFGKSRFSFTDYKYHRLFNIYIYIVQCTAQFKCFQRSSVTHNSNVNIIVNAHAVSAPSIKKHNNVCRPYIHAYCVPLFCYIVFLLLLICLQESIFPLLHVPYMFTYKIERKKIITKTAAN